MIINLYPGSKGDPFVGIWSWECKVTLELPVDVLEEGDLDYIKSKVKDLYESWDCEGVEDEIDKNCERIMENEMEIASFDGDNSLRSKSIVKLLTQEIDNLKFKNKELKAIFKK
jgi:hypothetical protein